MNNFIRSYEIILHHLQELQINATLFKQIRQPKLSNIELVAIFLHTLYYNFCFIKS